MKKVFTGIGGIMLIASGLVTWLFMMISLIHWWGLIGFFASFILSPGVVIFPFIYWLVENQFPMNYFLVWVVGIIGLLISSSASKE